MPTFNQLVRKGRQTSQKKSTAPALQKGFNSLKKKNYRYFRSAETWRVYCSKDRYPEETELSSS